MSHVRHVAETFGWNIVKTLLKRSVEMFLEHLECCWSVLLKCCLNASLKSFKKMLLKRREKRCSFIKRIIMYNYNNT